MKRITFLTTLVIAGGCTEQSPLQPARGISASVDHGVTAAALVVVDDGRATATDCGARRAVFGSIQAAVEAAASGDRILVCPGTYDEQVVVTKNDLTIASTDAGLAVLRPTVVTPNTTGLFTSAPLAPIVLVGRHRGGPDRLHGRWWVRFTLDLSPRVPGVSITGTRAGRSPRRT